MSFKFSCHALKLSFQLLAYTLMTSMLMSFLMTSARHRRADSYTPLRLCYGS